MSELTLIKEPIKDLFNDFKKAYENSLSSANPLLSQLIEQVYQSNGKQMRPTLVLLAGSLCGGVTEQTIHGAVALELLHLASLIHDDVVDESDMRRGKPSMRALFDNKVSVLGGDFILSTSMSETSMTRNLDAVATIANLGKELSNGEILQLRNSKERIYSENDYFEVIGNKTASLFVACCRIGALLAPEYNQSLDEAMERIGYLIGLCFQLRDDIFDYNLHAAIGKPTGQDLLEEKVTLPLLHVYLEGDDNLRRHIVDALENREIEYLQKLAHDLGGVEYAWSKLEAMRLEAIETVRKSFEPSLVRDALERYIDYVAERNI